MASHPQMRPREETVNENICPVSEEGTLSTEEQKIRRTGAEILRTFVIDLTRSRVWKLRDPSSGCLFSILIKTAFLNHATHLMATRWLP